LNRTKVDIHWFELENPSWAWNPSKRNDRFISRSF